jgi:hypothetical protein
VGLADEVLGEGLRVAGHDLPAVAVAVDGWSTSIPVRWVGTAGPLGCHACMVPRPRLRHAGRWPGPVVGRQCGRVARSMTRRLPQMGQVAVMPEASSSRNVVQPLVLQKIRREAAERRRRRWAWPR